MPLTASVAVLLAAALDGVVGEPPRRYHPVAAVGAVVDRCHGDWRRPVATGAVVAVALPLVVGGTAAGLVWLATAIHPVSGVAVAAGLLAVAISHRMLVAEVAAVASASDRDPEGARDRLDALVGRDASALSPGEIRSAAVESGAENYVDGLVAPLLAFALGALVALPVAAGAAAWIKTVNTLDSMLGYPAMPEGRWSARIDDAAMVVPARVGAVLLALAAAAPRAALDARRDARAPASTNAGWPMATMARLLDVRLNKPGRYELGEAPVLPSVEDAERSVAVLRRAGPLAVASTAVVAWL